MHLAELFFERDHAERGVPKVVGLFFYSVEDESGSRVKGLQRFRVDFEVNRKRFWFGLLNALYNFCDPIHAESSEQGVVSVSKRLFPGGKSKATVFPCEKIFKAKVNQKPADPK